jgi:NTE family protein
VFIGPSFAIHIHVRCCGMTRVGVVLGGGGAVGHGFHNGLLAALEETVGFDARAADVIVGTSSGATIAGLLRAGLTGSDLAGRACGEVPSSRMNDVDTRRAMAGDAPAAAPRAIRLRPALPAAPLGALAAARKHGFSQVASVIGALLPAGPVPTVSTNGPLHNLFPSGWPKDPLWIPAVGIDDGERVIFGRRGAPGTDVPTAVAASCALPGWFTPVIVENRRYIDGAVWSATNADVLAQEHLDVVIISAPLSGSASVLHWWQRGHLIKETRQLRSAGTKVIVIEPTRTDTTVMGLNIMDKRRRPAVTRHIRAAIRERLEHGDLAELGELVVGHDSSRPARRR